MSRRKDKQPRVGLASGVLLVDKPQGVTSHDVVAAVRRVKGLQRVGHAGTLDPMASGLLVVGFGDATRLLPYIVEHHKTYEALIRLGQSTSTDDAEGEVLAVSAAECQAAQEALGRIDESLLRQMVREHFTGAIEQVPSSYSALKIHGQRAYELARAGKEVQLEPRTVHIDSYEVLSVVRREIASMSAVLTGASANTAPSADKANCVRVEAHELSDARPNMSGEHGKSANGINAANTLNVIDVRVRITCSAGTYIRALARDLGALLGVGGHLTMLRRTCIGAFSVDEQGVVTPHVAERMWVDKQGEEHHALRAVIDAGEAGALLELSMAAAAARTMPVVSVSNAEAERLMHGMSVLIAAAALDSRAQAAFGAAQTPVVIAMTHCNAAEQETLAASQAVLGAAQTTFDEAQTALDKRARAVAVVALQRSASAILLKPTVVFHVKLTEEVTDDNNNAS